MDVEKKNIPGNETLSETVQNRVGSALIPCKVLAGTRIETMAWVREARTSDERPNTFQFIVAIIFVTHSRRLFVVTYQGHICSNLGAIRIRFNL